MGEQKDKMISLSNNILQKSLNVKHFEQKHCVTQHEKQGRVKMTVISNNTAEGSQCLKPTVVRE